MYDFFGSFIIKIGEHTKYLRWEGKEYFPYINLMYEKRENKFYLALL